MNDPNPIAVQVGLTIRHIQKQRGISQNALGEAVGITFQQIQKYERGANRISASMLVRLAKVLGVQPADLLPTTDATPLAPSAQFLSLRGTEELLEGYSAIAKRSAQAGRADASAGYAGDQGRSR